MRGVCASDADVRRARRLRILGWLLIEIATEIGVSEASVSRWVRGITRTSAGGLGGAPVTPAGVVAAIENMTRNGRRFFVLGIKHPEAITVGPEIDTRPAGASTLRIHSRAGFGTASTAKLIGTIAHPMNQARFDPAMGRVTEGYGLLQPRVGVAAERKQGQQKKCQRRAKLSNHVLVLQPVGGNVWQAIMSNVRPKGVASP